MKLIQLASPLLVLVLLAGCTPAASSGGDGGSDQSAPIDWKDAQNIEFVTDHRTSVDTSTAVFDDLIQQAEFQGSSVEWRPDAYGVPAGREMFVDDVFLSSGEGERGCALWIYGFSGWAEQDVDGGLFEWVEEPVVWGEFSDGILAYVLIYSDKKTECYSQAMKTIKGDYAPNLKVSRGIELDPSLVIEFQDESTMRLGNKGDTPIELNDEFCIVTENRAYIDRGYGRVTGVLNPGEAIRMSKPTPTVYKNDKTARSIAVGNCSYGEYRARTTPRG